MTQINVLISLHKGYGLGDAVQMSTVLRHVVAARPHWSIDYQAEPGRHQVGRGIVKNTFAYGDTYPSPQYDAEVQICLYDTWYGYTDKPNTHVTTCLRDQFGLEWDAKYGRYQIEVSNYMKYWALGVVPFNAVGFHYQGITAKDKKDLTHLQGSKICEHIQSLGCLPYMMNRLPLGYDAEVNCAVISRCRAFVGIDSGPSKCASATNTPSLVIWTGHHPAQFHDPAPNTTHLVPVGYHGSAPVNWNPGIIQWFEKNYKIREYSNGNLVDEVKRWLTETLQ